MSLYAGDRLVCRFGRISVPSVTYTRYRIDTIESPDDEHLNARNMQRIEINKYEKEMCVKLVIKQNYTEIQGLQNIKHNLKFHKSVETAVLNKYSSSDNHRYDQTGSKKKLQTQMRTRRVGLNYAMSVLFRSSEYY